MMRSTLFVGGPVRLASAAAVAAAIAFAMQAPTRAADAWAPAAPLNNGRYFAVAVTLGDGDVLVAGGQNSVDIATLGSAERYHPATDTWVKAAPMIAPTGRISHVGATVGNGNALIAGGWGVTEFDQQPLKSAEVFNTSTGMWSATGAMNFFHQDAAAATLSDGRVLVASGQYSLPPGSEVYDPATNTWTPTLPAIIEARTFHFAVTLHDGRVLVAGGLTGGNEVVASAEIYDPVTNAWTAAAPMSTARYAASAAVLSDGRVLVSGGSYGRTAHASAEIYDPMTNTWSPAPSMNEGRYSTTSTPLGDGRILVTGVAPRGNYLFASYQVFDGLTDTFLPGADITPAVSGPYSMARIPGGRVLAIGGMESYSTHDTTRVDVFGMNTPPLANAGIDQTVSGAPGLLTPVLLDGSASTDHDGDTLTYTWTEGSTVIATALGTASASVGFTIGHHVVTLTVSDAALGVSSDQVVIDVVADSSSGALAACQADLATAAANLTAANATIQQRDATIAQRNATMQQQAAAIADLQAQLATAQTLAGTLAQQNTQLTQQNTQLTQQNAQLGQQNAALLAQVTPLTQQVAALTLQNTALTSGITTEIDAVQDDFRKAFKSPAFVIGGSTPLARLHTLVSGILALKDLDAKKLYDKLR
jgi:hypothetical protein